MGSGCWVRKLKNPKPKTQHPEPNYKERSLIKG
jgi:hypothetical protein